MEDPKQLLRRRWSEAKRAGQLFAEALVGDERAVGRTIAHEIVREFGQNDEEIVDAELEEEGGAT